MARAFSLFFHCKSRSGFTLPELMISVLIVGLIATAASVDLRASQYNDELRTATRVLAADLRSLQSQALTGRNVAMCNDAGGFLVLCETSTALCAAGSACTMAPPSALGLTLGVGSSTYAFFADVDPAKSGGTLSDATEMLTTRDFALLGSPRVVIHGLRIPASVGTASVAFSRQNGTMGLSGCFAPSCTAPSLLIIELRHSKTGTINTIEVDAVTGRISAP